jgi:hypothetical protein
MLQELLVEFEKNKMERIQKRMSDRQAFRSLTGVKECYQEWEKKGKEQELMDYLAGSEDENNGNTNINRNSLNSNPSTASNVQPNLNNVPNPNTPGGHAGTQRDQVTPLKLRESRVTSIYGADTNYNAGPEPMEEPDIANAALRMATRPIPDEDVQFVTIACDIDRSGYILEGELSFAVGCWRT